jgi:hypothetical protein
VNKEATNVIEDDRYSTHVPPECESRVIALQAHSMAAHWNYKQLSNWFTRNKFVQQIAFFTASKD